jgi:preprotein translocase subunit YajC
MVSLLCTGFRPATCALGGACHMIPALLLPELAATAAKKSSSSSFILIILVIGVAAYFLLIRPNQQKAKKAKAAGSSIAEGDQVVTIGGIVGRVLSMEGDKVTIITGETDHGGVPDVLPTQLVMLRQAIARKVEPTVPVDEDDDHEYDDHDGHDGHDGREHDETTGDGQDYDRDALFDPPADPPSATGTSDATDKRETDGPTSGEEEPGK